MTPSVLWKSANAQTLLPSIICIRLCCRIYTYPMRNMVPNIVYSARGEEVVLSVVNGKIVMKDRKLVNVDEMEYMSKMNDCPDDIGKRAADEFFAINGTNAQFMREEKL